MEIIALSRVTCPGCNYSEEIAMPTDYCQFFHECSRCGTLLKAKEDSCCIFCSYGDVPCPPVQAEKHSRGE